MYNTWLNGGWDVNNIQKYGDSAYRPAAVVGMQLAPYENLQEQIIENQKEVVKYLKKQTEDGENWKTED
jgi:hypothetical protein